ncbi:MAG: hypothetical protein P1P93_08395 [Gammaproteobacteria bacterium]|nr:hypothetical protein [Gammaproteobacteria bacterium]
MSISIKALINYIHSVTVRERILLTGVICTLIYLVADSLILSKQEQTYKQQLVQLQQLSQQQQDNDLAIIEIGAQLSEQNIKQQQLKQNIELTQHQLLQQDQLLTDYLQKLVPPTQITTLLRSLLLEQDNGLQLVSLNNEPVESISLNELTNTNTTSENDDAVLYQHAATVKLAGTYQQLYQYITMLEQSPWQLFWDQLDYKVTNYPNAEIELRVHTLSSNEYWIGL